MIPYYDSQYYKSMTEYNTIDFGPADWRTGEIPSCGRKIPHPATEDGIYVDASKLGDKVFIGIVEILNAIVISYRRQESITKSTTSAELEAITLALKLFPNSIVHSDHMESIRSIKSPNVKYIRRFRNSLAHMCARGHQL